MFCTNCGAKLPEGESICPNCGAERPSAAENSGGHGFPHISQKTVIVIAVILAIIILQRICNPDMGLAEIYHLIKDFIMRLVTQGFNPTL